MTTSSRRTELGIRLGQKIQRLRVERNWSQAAVGRKAGVSPTYIRLIESGYAMPTLIVVVRLAPVFGLAPWELVRDITEPAP